MACCQGKEIDFKDLRTPEQQQMMKSLAPLLLSGISRGATPFGGMMTQPPDPSMLAAMNMMMNVGGQGNYNFPGMQTGAWPQPPQATPPLFNYDGPHRPNERPWPPEEEWTESPTRRRPTDFPFPERPPRDPYMPWYPPA